MCVRNHAVCFILPPHILRNVVENGSDAQKKRAHETMEISAAFRGERRAIGPVAALLAVPAGEKRRTLYDAGHSTDVPGTLVRGEGDDPVEGDDAVNEAYDGAGTTYDFYATIFGRNSVDDHGFRLDSTVHYGDGYDNALWNGRQMIYGDGDGELFNRFTVSIDVIGHELTHGVTQFTAGLAYAGETGALNEHYSDVFGSLVKQYSLGQTADKADWLIGRGLFTNRVNGRALRDMANPGTAYDDPVLGKDPQPATMADYVQTTEDFGGVHINSGIPNRAFYTLATTLGGKAWERAGAIWYAALTQKLGSNATFQDCAEATYAVAGERFGADSAEQIAVSQAWQAVGITVAKAIAGGGATLPVTAAQEQSKQPPTQQPPVQPDVTA